MTSNVGAVNPNGQVPPVPSINDALASISDATFSPDDNNKSRSGQPPTSGVGQSDNASGLSPVGPHLETNAHLGDVWIDSLGCVASADPSQQIANVDTQKLHEVYGSKAETIRSIGKHQHLDIETATNLASGPVEEIGSLLNERPNMNISQITRGGGIALNTLMSDPGTTEVLRVRPDLTSADLEGLWTNMVDDFKGQAGEAREAYDIALRTLASNPKVHPEQLSNMVLDLFEAPKDQTTITGKDVLDMMGMAQGLFATGASPNEIIQKICGTTPPVSQDTDSPASTPNGSPGSATKTKAYQALEHPALDN